MTSLYLSAAFWFLLFLLQIRPSNGDIQGGGGEGGDRDVVAEEVNGERAPPPNTQTTMMSIVVDDSSAILLSDVGDAATATLSEQRLHRSHRARRAAADDGEDGADDGGGDGGGEVNDNFDDNNNANENNSDANEETESKSSDGAKCNSERLRSIIKAAHGTDSTAIKRSIQSLAEERLHARFNVICAEDDFSYITNTEEYCQEAVGRRTCYVFRQLNRAAAGSATAAGDDERAEAEARLRRRRRLRKFFFNAAAHLQ